MEFLDFTNEQLRVIANVAMQYDGYVTARRELDAIPYSHKWHRSNGKQYLYEIRNARGDGKSLGPRSAETEEIKLTYDVSKERIRQRIESGRETSAVSAKIWRSLRLPSVAHEAAKILVELDTRNMLGRSLLVVGTNAFAVYEIEAGGRFLVGWDATEDFDLAWTGKLVLGKTRVPQTLFGLLKDMDSTWTINTERTFQARNARAYEVDLLSAPSVRAALPRGELSPLLLAEQEWLLLGTPIEHVVCSLAAQSIPARIVAPDPRWMALHKMWLARQTKRAAAKRRKDARQGAYLLKAVQARMPRFPLDTEFVSSIPEPLATIYREWQAVELNFSHLPN